MQKAEDFSKTEIKANDLTDWIFSAQYDCELMQLVDILKFIAKFDSMAIMEISETGLNIVNSHNSEEVYVLKLPKTSFTKWKFPEDLIAWKKFKDTYLLKCIERFKGRFHIEINTKKTRQLTLYEYTNHYFTQNPYQKLQYQIALSETDENDIANTIKFKNLLFENMKDIEEDGIIVDFTKNLEFLYNSMKEIKAPKSEKERMHVSFCIDEKDEFIFKVTNNDDKDLLEENHTCVKAIVKDREENKGNAVYSYEKIFNLLSIFKKSYVKDMEEVKFYFKEDRPLVISITTDSYSFAYIIASISKDDDEEEIENNRVHDFDKMEVRKQYQELLKFPAFKSIMRNTIILVDGLADTNKSDEIASKMSDEDYIILQQMLEFIDESEGEEIDFKRDKTTNELFLDQYCYPLFHIESLDALEENYNKYLSESENATDLSEETKAKITATYNNVKDRLSK